MDKAKFMIYDTHWDSGNEPAQSYTWFEGVCSDWTQCACSAWVGWGVYYGVEQALVMLDTIRFFLKYFERVRWGDWGMNEGARE